MERSISSQFLPCYTACQSEGQVNFWVSGDIFPNFNQLVCDCVFIIEEKYFWTKANEIDISDPIVDNEQTFHHHYKWPREPNGSHKFLKRRRYTLKANAGKSFRPTGLNMKLAWLDEASGVFKA